LNDPGWSLSVIIGARSDGPMARLFPLAALALVSACANSRPASPASGPEAAADDGWLGQVLYLAVTDRFVDGDPSNNALAPSDCFDPSNPKLFHGGDLAGLRGGIPYLSELGVTALWVTPLYAQVPLRDGSCGYHGYWADYVDPDDFALEAKLGTWADVDALTTALHAAGMRFVLDMVVNHSGRGARIVAEHPSWFHDDATCASSSDPTVFCSLHGLPDFAEEQPAVADYLTTMSRRWVTRVRPDGIRLDTAKHVSSTYLARGFVPAMRGADPGVFLLAEVFDTDSLARVSSVLDTGFDSAFHFPLQRALVQAFAQGGSVDAVGDVVASTFATLGHARTLRLVTMLDNHDLPRFLSGSPRDMPARELSRRYALALTALFTLPGIPQIYQGDELGMVGVYPDNRRDMPAWAWKDATRAGLHDGVVGDAERTWTLVKRLARLRAHESALHRGAYDERGRHGSLGSNVLAFTRRTRERAVLVLLGDDREGGWVTIPLGAAPAWRDGTTLHDLLGEGAPASAVVTAGAVRVRLPPLTAAVYAP
jgi:glycosidase